jgi:heterodisulfide reductase subunit B
MHVRTYIHTLRKQRMKYKDIAKLLGISYQRVHQLYTGYDSPSHKRPPSTLIPATVLKRMPKADTSLPNPFKQGQLDRVREWVRIRDKRTCQVCLKVWKKPMRRFDVHHLDEAKESTRSTSWDIKNTQRMVTLCHKCHLNLDSVNRKLRLSKRHLAKLDSKWRNFTIPK